MTKDKAMLRTKTSLTVFIASLLVLGLVLGGCKRSSTEQSDDDFAGSEFVSTEDAAGGLRISVNTTSIPVAGTTGFGVQVFDANGVGVPNVRVLCDSERGVAILEPTSGSSLTDSSGFMSGVIGCEIEGSFQFGCRLPLGGNKRKFENILCQGDTPGGFTGFPGSAGGGLGGGVVEAGDEGDIRINEIGFLDGDSAIPGFQIDITQDFCDPPANTQTEPFGDTSIQATIVNDTNQIIRLTSLTYSVANFDGVGGTYTQPTPIRFLGEVTLPADGGQATINALVFDASGGGKRFADNATFITAPGIRNVTITISGTNGAGERISVTARTAVSFDNFDLC